MRAVVQRVREAEVEANGDEVGGIGRGLVVLVGVGKDDTEKDVDYLIEKVLGLRIFDDSLGKMNLSIIDAGGEILAVSQFTLYGDCRKGRRPSFDEAATPVLAEGLYDLFVEKISKRGIKVKTGRFRSFMDLHLVNSGPVTILLDSKKTF